MPDRRLDHRHSRSCGRFVTATHVATLNKEIASLSKKLNYRDHQIWDLSKNNRQLLDDNKELENSCRRLESTCRRKSRELESLHLDVDKGKQAQIALEDKVDDLSAAVSKLTIESNQLHQEVTKQQSKVTEIH